MEGGLNEKKARSAGDGMAIVLLPWSSSRGFYWAPEFFCGSTTGPSGPGRVML